MGLFDWFRRSGSTSPADVPFDVMEGLTATRRHDVDERAAQALWAAVKDDIAEQLFELCTNHHSHGGDMPIDAADGIWSTMVEPTVRVSSPENLALTTTFTWCEDDDHVVTFYVEGGRPNGYSVDG